MKTIKRTFRSRVGMLLVGLGLGAHLACSAENPVVDTAGDDEPKQSQTAPAPKPEQAARVGAYARAYLAKLAKLVPAYSLEKLGDVHGAEARPSFLETRAPLEFASMFTSRPLEFVETRAGGRNVYKDAAREHVVKYDTPRGYLRFL